MKRCDDLAKAIGKQQNLRSSALFDVHGIASRTPTEINSRIVRSEGIEQAVALIVPPPESTSHPSLSLSSRITTLGFLLIAEFFYGWVWNSVDVFRPLFRQSLGIGLTQAGSAYSAQATGALIGAVTIGQLADRFGRRSMLAVVLSGFGLAYLAGLSVNSYSSLLVQHAVLGLFCGGSFPVMVGIYTELFAPNLCGKLASGLNATFSLALILLGMAFGSFGSHSWHLLLCLGGIPPVILAMFARRLIPTPQRDGLPAHKSQLPLSELFSPGLRKRTMLLALLTSLNFFSYQAFGGWLTSYLQGTLKLSPPIISHIITFQFAGNILGGFFWGWSSDRFGRRCGAIGFLIAAVAGAAFLRREPAVPFLIGIGFLYGLSRSADVSWGPWLTELFPSHLRSTASSIFSWGKFAGLLTPLLTGTIAEHYGLRSSMRLSSLAFVCAALIWLTLPDTLHRGNASSLSG